MPSSMTPYPCTLHSMLAVFMAGVSLFVGATLLLRPAAAAPGNSSPDLVARGKYVFGAASCGVCNTVTGKEGTPAGAGTTGRSDGSVCSTNITSDRQTGIGGWTDDQIIAAIRLGRRPNRERLIPVHPYMAFNGMADEDLRALVAYFRTVPPENRANLPKKITVPFFESVLLPVWLAAFASREQPPPPPFGRVGPGGVSGAGREPLRGVPHAARHDAGDGYLLLPGRQRQRP